MNQAPNGPALTSGSGHATELPALVSRLAQEFSAVPPTETALWGGRRGVNVCRSFKGLRGRR